MANKLLLKAREKGLGNSARLGLSILTSQATSRMGKSGRQFVFLSPQVDSTGAPHVLMQIIDEFAAAGEPRQIRLVAPHVEPDQLAQLERLGVRIDRAAVVMGPRLVKLQLRLRKHDFVLMNSAAVSPTYQRFILRALRTGTLRHASWLIHEDTEQLALVAPAFLDPAFRRQVAHLIERKRLTILVPSSKIKRGYDALLGQEVEVLKLRVAPPRRFRTRRPVTDYARIDFLLSGTPADGRKGQLIAVFAFHRFMRVFYDERPSDYRDFSLTLLSLGDDYMSMHSRLIGTSVLGDRLRAVERVPHDEALAIGAACNAVICCSMNEAFPLYVAEGMAMGHVLFRNDVGGVDEQLAPGVNGFRIDSDDIVQFASEIEQALNRTKTTDAELHAMGSASQAMILPYRRSEYRANLMHD